MKTSFWLRILTGVTALILSISVTLSFTLDAYSFYTGPSNNISIAPNDSEIAFSYHENGSTYIYTGNPDGSNIERLTQNNADEESPTYSPDGDDILFLSETQHRIYSLFTVDRTNQDAEPEQLTDKQLHIRDAVFSKDNSTIYFLGIDAKDWMANEQNVGGFDLYAFDRETEQVERLTEQNYMLMSSLSISPSGDYALFNAMEDGEEKVITHPLGQEADIPSAYQQFPEGIYGPVLSPDGQQVAYSTMSDLSTSGTYEYELFLYDNESGQSERLTTVNSNVESPAFYHDKNELLYYEDHNWPQEPTDYSLISIDLSNKDTTTIDLQMPKPEKQIIGAAANALTNDYTSAGLYVLVGGLFVFHFRKKPIGIYIPGLISILLTLAVYLISLFFHWTYQAITLALGPVTTGLAICTILFWILPVIIKRNQ
ncbi:Tol biopolymer transport system component [Salibacterium salarium]|uniref:hypothetical protein n=1 Tax=Salibacterium salarium TaxID=284579 RepID=UPI002787E6F0|nr:hypothetical protein [Salibacterium salarium]MDQ0300134.1 Tol biopolymer transport system component [Salibacterium salarium]